MRECHCWLVQQCFCESIHLALLDKPAVAPSFNGLPIHVRPRSYDPVDVTRSSGE